MEIGLAEENLVASIGNHGHVGSIRRPSAVVKWHRLHIVLQDRPSLDEVSYALNPIDLKED
jgi:hypothetical protein